jgi:hypothetical protein
MRSFGPLISVLITAMIAIGLRSEGNAGALHSISAAKPPAETWSDLLVQIKKNKNKDDNKCARKKVSCPAGYVVLDKPNKYGACCEPKEGLPPTPSQQEAEKCKFPGQVGTPPNCTCPDGTEFLGFKGCVKFTTKQYCSDNNQAGDRLLNKDELLPFRDKCKSQYYGTASCATFSTEGLGQYRCCCYYRNYAN